VLRESEEEKPVTPVNDKELTESAPGASIPPSNIGAIPPPLPFIPLSFSPLVPPPFPLEVGPLIQLRVWGCKL